MSRAGKQGSKSPPHKQGNYWVKNVKTVSTNPPAGIFTKDAQTIARVMASKKVSPKGLVSGLRMIQFHINRGGKGLSAARKRELEKARKILQGMREMGKCVLRFGS